MEKKLRFVYRIFALATAVFIGLSFSGNPPNGFTGAPGDATCNNCHFGGTQTGVINIEGITDNPIIPNKTYNVTVRISLFSGSSTRAGFQFVALDGNTSGAASTGTFSNLGTNVGTNTAGLREYAEHNGGENSYSGGDATYTFDWTAPATATNNIAFYAVGNIANGLGTSGDLIVFDNAVNIPLPVELVNFNIEDNGKSEVELNWSTASERNSDYFEVMRSKDGIEFETIAQIPAAGSSDKLLNYSFTDNDPLFNRNSFYKLKQVDYDDQFAYSAIEAIQVKSFQDYYINVFPNPARNNECLFIDFISSTQHPNATIGLYNLNGQNILDDPQMFAGIQEGFNKFVFDINDLPEGQYFLNITDQGNVLANRSIIVVE